MPETISDFWRMVWDHELYTIVMLQEEGEDAEVNFIDVHLAHFDGEHDSRLKSYYASTYCPFIGAFL